MKILIVAATYIEIKGLFRTYNFSTIDDDFYTFMQEENEIDILVAGIGIAFTIYSLTKRIHKKKYDLIINIGIAGSFNRDICIGETTLIKEDQFGDLGIENKNDFQTLFESGFISPNIKPFKNGKLVCNINGIDDISNLRKVSSVTVNMVSGSNNSVEKLREKFNADIESMEGAAFFYVCLMENIRFIQIRAISNYVEERNKSKWDIPLAVSNLTRKVEDLLLKINK